MDIIYFAGGNRVKTLKKIVDNDNYHITKIYVTSKEKHLTNYQLFASENNIQLIISDKGNIEKLFKYNNEDILLSVGYRFIIPKGVYSIPKYAINIHPSLLPKYRGAYSGYAIIENGEKETGITAHFIDDGIDTGDIINQKRLSIDISDNLLSMTKKISTLEPKFTLETLRMLENNTFSRLCQNEENYVYNIKRRPEDSKIDPAMPLISLIDRIRACDSRFPAYFLFNDKKVKVKLEFSD